MCSVKLHDKTFVPYIKNEELMKAIANVAGQISARHKDDPQPPVLLCVLNGGLLFTAELLKLIDLPVELQTVRLASYSGTDSVGPVRMIGTLGSELKGRNVIICEDIVDTGKTMVFLHELLLKEGAASVEICTMLLKPEVYKQPLALDYVGMEIENRFIVGFGLDYDQLGRNLNDIYILE
ncbi:MAG: phosphoribosyltransferase [Candidatus Cryptobacteroides sp.]